MKKVSALFVSLLLAVAGILALGQPSSAMPCNGPGCTGESTTGYPPSRISCWQVMTPAQPAVIGYETIPAVTETLFEYVHRNPNNPNSPRWEAEGWNADSNPNSVGWTSTGVSKEVIIQEEGMRLVEISPEIPEQVTEECEEDTFFPTPDSPVAPIPVGPDAPTTTDPVKPVTETEPEKYHASEHSDCFSSVSED